MVRQERLQDPAYVTSLIRERLHYVMPGEVGYVVLDTRPAEPHIEVQKVTHPSRVHLDIETDDVEAEVRRLEALGAKRVRAVRTFWVMEAPTGQRFCVVRASSPGFEAQANRWP